MVGDPSLNQAAGPNRSTTPVSASRPVAKPRAKSLSRKAHRKIQPRARRVAAATARNALPPTGSVTAPDVGVVLSRLAVVVMVPVSFDVVGLW